MIRNDVQDNIFKRSEITDNNRSMPYSRARSSSVGSSDDDTKVRYKNLYRKQSSFERNAQSGLPNMDSLNGIIPSIFQQQQQHQPTLNNISNLYKIPEQHLPPMIPTSNVIAESPPQNKSVINLPEILDENDEINILRHLIQLLSAKVNKLNEEKRQLFQHISTINQINQELVNIIQQRFQK